MSASVSLLFFSALCLNLSGSIVIYFESALKIDKISKGEKLRSVELPKLGELRFANIIANTLFDIGLLGLIGSAFLLLLEIIIVSDFSKMKKEQIFLMVVILLITLINSIRKRRFFI